MPNQSFRFIGKLAGSKTSVLCDTLASDTFLSHHTLSATKLDLNIEPAPEVQVELAYGLKVPVIGKVTVPIHVQRYKAIATFLVLNLHGDYDVILE